MRARVFSVLLALFAITAFAEPARFAASERIESLLAKAYKVKALEGDDVVVLYRVPNEHNASCVRAAFVSSDFSTMELAAVPEHGSNGLEQVVGAASLGGGRVVLSTFWISEGSSTVQSGFAFFRRNGAHYVFERVVPSPPVYDVEAMTDGSFVGVLFVAHDRTEQGLPLVARFDRDGKELARGAYLLPAVEKGRFAKHVVQARIERIGADRFALFDGESQKVHELSAANLRDERTIDLRTLGSGRIASILGFDDGSLFAIARSPEKLLIDLAPQRLGTAQELRFASNHFWARRDGTIGVIGGEKEGRAPVGRIPLRGRALDAPTRAVQ